MFRTVFWGVRGSVPVPGPATVETGGNTSCVEVRCGPTLLVFDAGTGLRVLGRSLAAEYSAPQVSPHLRADASPLAALRALEAREVHLRARALPVGRLDADPGAELAGRCTEGPLVLHLFFSHVHWDHIQGFPFFAPAFVKGNTIHMYGGRNVCGTVESALAGQMESPGFPVWLRDLPSNLVFHDLHEGQAVNVEGAVRVTTAAGNHPGGVLAYRIDYDGRSLVYATDTEHYAVPDPKLAALARGTDVLIHDSQYTPEEYRGEAGVPRTGWGHSTFEGAIALANACGAGRYVLYHHDPDQDDAAVREKERRARALFPRAVAAREGLIVEL